MISSVFEKEPAFIGYLTAGDGGIPYTVDCCLALVEGGVNILEIGFPFTDPIADGPVIQGAMTRALNLGFKAKDFIEIIKKVRLKTDVPIVIFSYYNPLYRLGKSFLEEAQKAGANAVLVVDLPLEGELDLPQGLDRIMIATPYTSEERLKKISEKGKGFIYYVSRKGTTGMSGSLPSDFKQNVKKVKELTSLPVAVGFGIANLEMAREVLNHADGFIVGSYFVDAVGKKVPKESLKNMASAIDPRKKIMAASG